VTRGARSGPAPIGEREFHAWLARHLASGRRGLLPLGDDAAALVPPAGRVAVLTTDALVEGTHFRRDSPPERVGRAAAAVSLSDCAAKGAEPAGLLLDLLVPAGSSRAWARAVELGADRMGRQFGAPLVGGDTKPSRTRSVVSTVIGWGTRGRLAPRTGARPGDLVVTTGVVGRGGLAAHHLATAGGSASARTRAVRELLDVRPRVREGIALARWARAMIDTSDGLADASRLLAEASRARVVIREDLLPVAPGVVRLAPRARDRALVFGGDYELLATLPPAATGLARRAVARVGGTLTTIGRVEPGSGAWLERAGASGRASRTPMPEGGWRPFEARRAHSVAR
jgi:thiamine-monophosphate kinase